ncbi:hypothetical protein L2E82_44964 [Cichorium intybus]|uniref:Uncharacterized protein n=1 Tax=Cichorium intybus TaxID=13427 RepID=A0ACB8ZT03_CICIN|nr:hypothetical protein L2E82_44964 [Cichorium intybus]
MPKYGSSITDLIKVMLQSSTASTPARTFRDWTFISKSNLTGSVDFGTGFVGDYDYLINEVMDYMDTDQVVEVPDTPERFIPSCDNDANAPRNQSDGSSSCRVITKIYDVLNNDIPSDGKDKDDVTQDDPTFPHRFTPLVVNNDQGKDIQQTILEGQGVASVEKQQPFMAAIEVSGLATKNRQHVRVLEILPETNFGCTAKAQEEEQFSHCVPFLANAFHRYEFDLHYYPTDHRKRRGYAKAANAVQLTIDSIWTCLIIGDEREHPKPTPDPYLKAIEVLNVSKAHTFMCKVKSTIAFWIFNLVGFTCSAKVEAVTWE